MSFYIFVSGAYALMMASSYRINKKYAISYGCALASCLLLLTIMPMDSFFLKNYAMTTLVIIFFVCSFYPKPRLNKANQHSK
jgi:hypothetical protein